MSVEYESYVILCTIKQQLELTATIKTDGTVLNSICGYDIRFRIFFDENSAKCGSQMLQVLSLQDITS